MADNGKASTDPTLAWDDVGSVIYPRGKTTLGADGTATGDWAGRAVDGGSGVAGYTDNRPSILRVEVDSAGLTTASTAYVADDQLGTIMSFAGASRVSGGPGILRSATLLDKAKVTGGVDLYLFDRSVTLAADNAAADFSDADAAHLIDIISFPNPAITAANSLAPLRNINTWYVLNGSTTLYGALVTRAAHTFFGAVGDLRVQLTLELL